MRKVKDNENLMKIMEMNLKRLQNTIEEMEEKRGSIFIRWLDQQNKYLEWEFDFDPKRLKRYKRGEVVHIHFGFNAGSEHGGPHWAVVLDDNKRSSPTAVVLPLGSLSEDQSCSDVHTDDVYLGVIPAVNDNKVFAIPTQIRAISKLRITKPKKTKDTSYFLTNEQLDAIDRKIFDLFFKKSKAIYSHISEAASTSEIT
ncbi:type II toxin-antitoxin system PemK/MazF family toxin [Paenibacillus sp. 3LSP]|uniref:type II toxin-antitoxin system PemK/MazF family toxin n=1 Tax=Paenibacillus sp. 3LSP TaxID=2800795 RepID=UPI0028FDBA3E|nr:type II toxin-antitoxin system PemK/MazF family toxin [Paenibacillus sp. 3LSP]MDU0331203.1 type II toxin-antitoxin system PemK/MazF family toxin [Paenibacillus sp. 3LSP]